MSDQDQKAESVFLGLLNTTAVRITGIVLVVAGFYSAVIIPLNRIQVQLAEIQVELADAKQSFTTINAKDIEQDQTIQRNSLLLDQLIKSKN